MNLYEDNVVLLPTLRLSSDKDRMLSSSGKSLSLQAAIIQTCHIETIRLRLVADPISGRGRGQRRRLILSMLKLS